MILFCSDSFCDAGPIGRCPREGSQRVLPRRRQGVRDHRLREPQSPADAGPGGGPFTGRSRATRRTRTRLPFGSTGSPLGGRPRTTNARLMPRSAAASSTVSVRQRGVVVEAAPAIRPSPGRLSRSAAGRSGTSQGLRRERPVPYARKPGSVTVASRSGRGLTSGEKPRTSDGDGIWASPAWQLAGGGEGGAWDVERCDLPLLTCY